MKIKSMHNTESKVIYIFEPRPEGIVYMCNINIFGEMGNNSICFKEGIE